MVIFWSVPLQGASLLLSVFPRKIYLKDIKTQKKSEPGEKTLQETKKEESRRKLQE